MNKVILFATLAVAVISCNKAGEEGVTSPTAVELAGGIVTRASGTTWNPGDKIGVYMLNNGTTSICDEKGNVEYYNSNASDGTSASFKPVNASETIYYPEGEVAVDFLAYYPYDADKVGVSDFVYEVDVNTAAQADQSLIDLMVSDNLKDRYLTTDKLSMEFLHALSQLNFVVEAGTGAPSLEGVTISVAGLINDATYNLTTKEITLNSTSTDLEISDNSAIIIPQTAELVITITTDDNPTGFVTPATPFSFNAGEATTITLVLSRTGVSFGEGENGGTITDWVSTSQDIEVK